MFEHKNALFKFSSMHFKGLSIYCVVSRGKGGGVKTCQSYLEKDIVYGRPLSSKVEVFGNRIGHLSKEFDANSCITFCNFSCTITI